MRVRKQKESVCVECRHAKHRSGESCYCIKYGIIIGYNKVDCRGYDRDEVPQSEDGS